MRNTRNKKGFTIVELLVAILIFSIGGLSAYLLVYAAINSSVRSKNEIIAGNISREKIELIKNMRDTNWIKNLDWNKLDSGTVSHDIGTDYLTGGFYRIENDFRADSTLNPSIVIKRLSSSFADNKSYITNPAVTSDKIRLCMDDRGRYTSDCVGNRPTNFYSFIKVEPLITRDAASNPINVNNAIKLTSIIYNSEKGFTKWSISTIITDWKR